MALVKSTQLSFSFIKCATFAPLIISQKRIFYLFVQFHIFLVAADMDSPRVYLSSYRQKLNLRKSPLNQCYQ